MFCGKCGHKNPDNYNFCYHCGFRIVAKNELEDQIIYTPEVVLNSKKEPTESDITVIRVLLEKLLKYNGFFTIEIRDFYVQLSSVDDKGTVLMEAVSKDNLPSLLVAESEFIRLGYVHHNGENYTKQFELTEALIDSIINEILELFTEIYQVEFDKYSINEEFLIRKSTAQNNQQLFFIFLGLIILMLFSVSQCNDSSTSELINPPAVENSSINNSVSQVKKYLQENLKDPDSYQGIEWGEVFTVANNDSYKYYVRHKYRAKNGFGGYMVSHQIFYLDINGNVVSVEDYKELF